MSKVEGAIKTFTVAGMMVAPFVTADKIEAARELQDALNPPKDSPNVLVIERADENLTVNTREGEFRPRPMVIKVPIQSDRNRTTNGHFELNILTSPANPVRDVDVVVQPKPLPRGLFELNLNPDTPDSPEDQSARQTLFRVVKSDLAPEETEQVAPLLENRDNTVAVTLNTSLQQEGDRRQINIDNLDLTTGSPLWNQAIKGLEKINQAEQVPNYGMGVFEMIALFDQEPGATNPVGGIALRINQDIVLDGREYKAGGIVLFDEEDGEHILNPTNIVEGSTVELFEATQSLINDINADLATSGYDVANYEVGDWLVAEVGPDGNIVTLISQDFAYVFHRPRLQGEDNTNIRTLPSVNNRILGQLDNNWIVSASELSSNIDLWNEVQTMGDITIDWDHNSFTIDDGTYIWQGVYVEDDDGNLIIGFAATSLSDLQTVPGATGAPTAEPLRGDIFGMEAEDDFRITSSETEEIASSISFTTENIGNRQMNWEVNLHRDHDMEILEMNLAEYELHVMRLGVPIQGSNIQFNILPMSDFNRQRDGQPTFQFTVGRGVDFVTMRAKNVDGKTVYDIFYSQTFLDTFSDGRLSNKVMKAILIALYSNTYQSSSTTPQYIYDITHEPNRGNLEDHYSDITVSHDGLPQDFHNFWTPYEDFDYEALLEAELARRARQ